MLTVTLLIALAAFVCAVLAALGKAPLWVAVMLITVALLLQVLPR
jgi:hypothetical protein